MGKLVKGVLKFHQQFFVENKTLFDELVRVQKCEADYDLYSSRLKVLTL